MSWLIETLDILNYRKQHALININCTKKKDYFNPQVEIFQKFGSGGLGVTNGRCDRMYQMCGIIWVFFLT